MAYRVCVLQLHIGMQLCPVPKASNVLSAQNHSALHTNTAVVHSPALLTLSELSSEPLSAASPSKAGRMLEG